MFSRKLMVYASVGGGGGGEREGSCARMSFPTLLHTSFLVISHCDAPRAADQIHAHLVTTGHFRTPRAATHTLLSLASTQHPPLHHLALRILTSYYCYYCCCCDSSSNPIPTYTDPFLWNAIIKSSSHGDHPHQAILTFTLMLSHMVPDRFSFSLVLKACSRLVALQEGMQLHGLMVKMGLALDLFLQNCLVCLYCRCGLVERARLLFDRMTCMDSVSWNSMIDGYAKKGMMEMARELFDEMGEEERSTVTWNSMISGYARLGCLEGIHAARVLFDRMDDHKDVMPWNSMIHGYVKRGMVENALDLFERMPDRDVIAWANVIFGFMETGSVDVARYLFDAMPEKDVITWNILMSGYVKNGCFVEALSLFHEMHRSNEAPDAATLAIALSAVAELGHLHEGLYMHNYILGSHLPLNGKLGVALIDMYAKCGRLEKALHVFQVSGARSVDHWNAMIGGMAIHGLGRLALRLLSEMLRLAITPNDITFIGVLNACSHSGLVEEGLTCFEMMRHYNLNPNVQHYGCMVDILARAGRLEEARNLIKEMPMTPNDVILRSLLSACRNQGNIDIGQKVAKHMIEIGYCDSSSYVLLSNIYAGVGMWNNAKEIRMKMREQDIRKIRGCSWIEIDGAVHEFVMGDTANHQSREIDSLVDDMCMFKSSNSIIASES